MNNDGVSNLVSKVKGQKDCLEVKLKGSRDNAPKPFMFRDSRRSFVPDMVAVYAKKQDFYAIEKKITKELLPNLIAKWILFALEARAKSGQLFLVVSEQDATKCQTIIDKKLLSVELIAIPK